MRLDTNSFQCLDDPGKEEKIKLYNLKDFYKFK